MATPSADLKNVIDFPTLFQGRRFGSVSIPASSVVDPRDGQLRIGLIATESESRFAVDSWTVHRVSSEFSNSYFGKIPRANFAVGDQFLQEFYIALAPAGSDVALIISPFVRLLDRVLTRVSSITDPHHPLHYIVPDLDDVFRLFENDAFDFMNATRISVKKDEDPIIDLVSLSGRNPLKSNLREDLRKAGNAYSIRMAVGPKGGQINVHLDRFGNLSWFQRTQSDLWAPLSAFGGLLESSKLRSVKSRPTRRIIDSSPINAEDEGS